MWIYTTHVLVNVRGALKRKESASKLRMMATAGQAGVAKPLREVYLNSASGFH